VTTRRILALYGVVLAAVVCGAGWQLWSTSHVTVMGSRLTSLTSAIDVVDHGGPPLLAATLPYSRSWQTSPQQSYRSAAYTDDPGIFLYVPEAAHVLGVHDPRVMLKLLALGSFALLALVYPLLFFELFGSVAAAVVAPLLGLAVGALTLRGSDIYWVQGWCALLCLPPLFLVATRRWTRWSAAACVGIALVASYASSIRSEAGLGVVLAALAVVAWRAPTWRRRVGIALLVVLAYLAIRPALFKGIEAYRDHRIAAYIDTHPAWQNVSSAGHPFWHSAYIGLGYLPNRWGIVWSDSNAAAAVRRVDPNAQFLSARYSSILRDRYFHIVASDPWFVVHTYAVKAAVELNDALKRFAPALVVLPALLLYGPRRKLLRTATLLTLPTIVIQFAPPVLTLPGVYGVGFVAAVGLLGVLAGCELATLAEQAIRRRGERERDWHGTVRRSFRTRRAWIAAAAAVVVLVAAVALHSQHLVLRTASAAARPTLPRA
jgi:hypothetical protein